MPLPSPQNGESSEDYIGRCMDDSTMSDEYPDNDQRLAVCQSLYQDKKSMKKLKEYQNATIIKSDEEQIVFGPVYVPESIDSDGETITRNDIKQMAYGFLSSGKTNKIDIGHSCKESGNLVVESYLARDNDPDFTPGTWLMAVKVVNKEDWANVKKGILNGFSFFGTSKKQSKRVLVEILTAVSGKTETSADGVLPPHAHDYFIEFDDDGNIIQAKTSIDLEHSHNIAAVDSTDRELDHGHRIKIEED